MLDDTELDTRLRGAAARLVADPVAAPRRVTDLEPTARARGDRRVVRVVAGLAAVAVVAGAVFVVASKDPKTTFKLVTAPRTTPRVALDRDGLPLELPGITREQMQAHLGAGVPKGWQPLDFYEARVWVPGIATDCGDTSRAGESRSWYSSCSQIPTGADKVTLSRLDKGKHQVLSTSTVHGYRLEGYGLVSGAIDLVAPELQVRIAIAGPRAQAILKTLAPSASRVVEAKGTEPTPSSWRAVTFERARFSVPGTWGVNNLGAFCGNPDGIVRLGPSRLVASCPITNESHVLGSVTAYRNFDSGPGPFAGDIAVSFVVGYADIQIRFGHDGRVARAILHSARPVRSTTVTVEGCPAKPSVRHNQFPGSKDRLVPDDLVRGIACSYESGGLLGAQPLIGDVALGLATYDRGSRLCLENPQRPDRVIVESKRFGKIVLQAGNCVPMTNGDFPHP